MGEAVTIQKSNVIEHQSNSKYEECYGYCVMPRNVDILQYLVENNLAETNDISLAYEGRIERRNPEAGSSFDHCLDMLRILKDSDVPIKQEIVTGVFEHDNPETQNKIAKDVQSVECQVTSFRETILCALENSPDNENRNCEPIKVEQTKIAFNNFFASHQFLRNVELYNEISKYNISTEHAERITRELLLELYSGNKINATPEQQEQCLVLLTGINLPLRDPEELYKIINRHDARAVLISAAELINNGQYPNPDVPFKSFLDKVELQTTVGGTTQFCGVENLSQICFQTARALLRGYSTTLEDAKEYCAITENPEVQNEIDNLFGRIKYLLESLDYKVTRKDGNPKHPTSTEIKFTNKQKENLPDLFRTTMIFRSEVGLKQIVDAIRNIVQMNNGSESPFWLGHTYNEPPIEIHNSEGCVLCNSLSELDNFIECHDDKANGYQNANLNFYFIYDSQVYGVEVKLQTENQYIHNTYGEASHIFYKFQKAYGEWGMINQTLKEVENIYKNFNAKKYIDGDTEQDTYYNNLLALLQKSDIELPYAQHPVNLDQFLDNVISIMKESKEKIALKIESLMYEARKKAGEETGIGLSDFHYKHELGLNERLQSREP